MLLQTYAKMKKGYSHIKYDVTNEKFHAYVFLGDPVSGNIVVDDLVPKQNLLTKKYAPHVNAAIRELNFYHFLHAILCKLGKQTFTFIELLARSKKYMLSMWACWCIALPMRESSYDVWKQCNPKISSKSGGRENRKRINEACW